MQADPRLDPTGAVLVEPDTDMLRPQLLFWCDVTKDFDHYAEGLQQSKSKFWWNLIYLALFCYSF